MEPRVPDESFRKPGWCRVVLASRLGEFVQTHCDDMGIEVDARASNGGAPYYFMDEATFHTFSEAMNHERATRFQSPGRGNPL